MLGPELSMDAPRIYRVSTADPITLFGLCRESMPHFLSRFSALHPEQSIFGAFIDHLRHVHFTSNALLTVLVLAVLFTVFRYILQYATKSWVRHHHVSPLYSHKIAEAVWKLAYYGSAWLFALFIHYNELPTFSDPLSMWDDWKNGTKPAYKPPVVVLYAIQTGFYTHSLWATLYMDQWRSDSIIMLVHHFVAIALLALSYVDNYTLAGALVFLLQDNSDAILEIAKLCVYLKKRTNGDFYPSLDLAGKVILQIFGIVWMIFRLYWFPCKLLYACLYGGVYLGPQDSPVFSIIGSLLILLYFLNVFWFN
ncbi:unnamed protein product, partial [Mesorhabditis belari]|uniref:TLC domain-containing protein n=1 Tax=Mesorhabditis belari TaxID=2138241 RepID=A0AAF3EHK5_9BILA